MEISSRKRTILIVDDEPDILDLLAEVFRYREYKVLTAMSGKQAIDILKKDCFDIVLSDFRMADGNGLSVLNYVNSINSRPLFCFISGQADMSEDDCLKAGADFFFSKPFDISYLVQEVESLIEFRCEKKSINS